jgi:uncharacterized protein (DUF58 family)
MTSPPGLQSAPPVDLLQSASVLRRLELEVDRRLDGLITGDYLAWSAGPGTERSGARRYEPSDDARRIDWNLSARSLEPQVRTTQADRELETTIIVDRSASLDFGTHRREKREVVLAVVAAFGILTARGGNRLHVLIAGGDQLVRIPPRHDRRGVMAALATVDGTPRRETPPGAGADLAAALDQVDRGTKRRGLIVVVSDFLDRTNWATPLRRLAIKHQVLAVAVSDPREMSLPAVGMLTLVDSETGRRIDVQSNSAGLRKRYADAAQARQDTIRHDLVATGAKHLALSTDRDWVLDIANFVTRRREVRGL